MFRKIIGWALIALVIGIGLTIVYTAALHAWQKTAEPAQNARTIAAKKAKDKVQCTPLTNKNCFTLTADQLVRIQKMRDGLPGKNN